MGTRRKYTKDFKLSVLSELDAKPFVQVCRQHNLHPSLLSKWKREFNSNPKEAFSGNGNVWKEEAKVAERERLIGQLYAENAFLKKALETLKQHMAEERIKGRQSAK
jgi:transposase